MISIIIPTYKEPEYLDLCLNSITSNQYYNNEIIVVVDGYYDYNKSILDKYNKFIKVLNFKHNCGISKSTNHGVYNSTNKYVLILNDDNVVPKHFDKRLLDIINTNKDIKLLSINQIEPKESIYSNFVIENLGVDPTTFDIKIFNEYEQTLKDSIIQEGYTLPILIEKDVYLSVGGWDESYPGNTVVDWDFFYKLQLNSITPYLTKNIHIYHFVSKATIPTQDDILKRVKEEQKCWEYFKYKWSYLIKRNTTNSFVKW